jgi:tetratricopeptide (TPR) repeat protein
LLVLAGAVLPWLPIDRRTEANPGWCAHVSANLAYMDGDLKAAEELYSEALSIDDGDLDAHNWLARTLARRGEYDAAAVHVEAILAEIPDHFPTLKFMASLKHKQGDVQARADLLLRAYRVPGRRTNTGAQAVKALRLAGRGAEARRLMEADPAVAQRVR